MLANYCTKDNFSVLYSESLYRSFRYFSTQTQPKTPHFVQLLSQSLLEWREEYKGLPVLTWQDFLEKGRLYVNPLVTEETMAKAVLTLHDMGEVSGVITVVVRGTFRTPSGLAILSMAERLLSFAVCM